MMICWLDMEFETLRGTIKQHSMFFEEAPNIIKTAIEQLNLLIHRWESYNSSTKSPRIVVTFDHSRPRIPLDEEDYNLFSFERYYGQISLNYCEVGKPIVDVIKDDDLHVSDENIRPLNYYSGDFNMYFGKVINKNEHEEIMGRIWIWFDSNKNKLDELGIKHF